MDAGSQGLKVALVTTPALVTSQIGRHARRLLPELARHCEVQVFVEGGGGDGEMLAARLDPQAFDRILYQLGNEVEHAFMLPMIRALGGGVVLHDWELTEPARKAYPGLDWGGLRGFFAALREGGLGQARAYSAGGGDSEVPLTLNRSAVRFADSFLVHSTELKLQVIRERNAVTPVGVLTEPLSGDMAALAAEYAGFLEDMPPHRSKKRASIPVQAWRELQARRAEQEAERAP